MNAQEARDSLNQVIREQLAAAYARGVDTAPHGASALADPGAAPAFTAVTIAVSTYTGAIAQGWLAQAKVFTETTETKAGAS